MPGPPAPRGCGFPTWNSQTSSHSQESWGAGGAWPPLPPHARKRCSSLQTQPSLRKVDLLRELRQFICNRQAFPSLLAHFFF